MRRFVTVLAAVAVAAAASVTAAETALASTSVTNLAVALSPDTSAATNATYAVNFETSSTGALAANSGTITLQASPTSTTWPAVASDYTVDGTAASTVSAPSGGVVTVTTPAAIPASSEVTVEVAGVINPVFSGSNASGGTMTVATSADAATASTSYPLATYTSVTAVGVTAGGTAGSANNQYVATFKTTTALTTAAHDTITLTVPGSNTTFASAAADYTVNGTVATSATPNAAGNSVVLGIPANIAAGATVTVDTTNTTDPTPTGYYTLDASTSGDTNPVPSPAFQITGTPPGTVSAVTIGINPTTAGATNSIYTVTFDTSSAGSLSGTPVPGPASTITITAPGGTAWSSTSSDYSVNGTAPSSVAPGTGPNQVVITLATNQTIMASSPVKVVANNTTNPSVASTGNTVTVSTSADTGTATSNQYSITPANTPATGPSNATVVVTPNTTGQAATYTVGFDTSGSGSLAANSGFITLSAPTNTLFPATAPSYKVDGTAPSTVTLSAGGATAQVTTPIAIGDSTAVSIQILNVTNPEAGTFSLQVSTSSDTAIANSSSYTIESGSSPQTAVSSVTAVLSNNAAGAGATYSIGFTTSSAGASSPVTPDPTKITLTAPPSTSFANSSYTINGTAAPTATPSGNSVVITVPPGATTLGGGNPITVVASNVGNPIFVGYDTLAVSTDADADPAASTLYQITPGTTSVSQVTVTVNPNVASSPGTYNIGFDTSGSGAVAAGGTISVVAPAGTIFPSTASDYSVNGTPATTVSPGTGSNADMVTVTTPVAFDANTAVSLVISAVTNPAAGTNYTLTVATSSDTAPATSGPYTIAATSASSVSGVTVTPTPATATVKATYKVVFTTSSSGALSPGTSQPTITLAGPAGTGWSSTAGDYTVNGTAASSVAVSGSSVTITLALTQSIPASTQVTVDAANTVNPSTPGSYTMSVATSADTVAQPSADYTITSVPKVTSLSPTTGPVAGGTSVTITGQGFTGATGVKFGTFTASFTIVGDTTITATSPASSQPGTVDVTVTVGSITSATSSADQFTYTSAASGYVALASPQRLFDSRTGEADAVEGGQGVLAPSVIVTVPVSGKAGVPATGVTAVAVNVTAVGPAGDGNLRVYPDTSGNGQTAAPTIATINYIPNAATPNFDIVEVPGDGTIDMESFGSATNAIIDVVGYFTTASGYTPQSPVRILDTRPPNGNPMGPLATGTVYPIDVSGAVPSSATAIAINVGTIESAGDGNLRVYPDSGGGGTTAAPTASTVNYNPGQSVDNFVLVQIPADKKIDIESFGSTTNVTFDVVGYAISGLATQTPTRILDSR
ncbi:MAG: beta strand repeat-containing protein, partial [Mycobacteriales bacterium]